MWILHWEYLCQLFHVTLGGSCFHAQSRFQSPYSHEDSCDGLVSTLGGIKHPQIQLTKWHASWGMQEGLKQACLQLLTTFLSPGTVKVPMVNLSKRQCVKHLLFPHLRAEKLFFPPSVEDLFSQNSNSSWHTCTRLTPYGTHAACLRCVLCSEGVTTHTDSCAGHSYTRFRALRPNWSVSLFFTVSVLHCVRCTPSSTRQHDGLSAPISGLRLCASQVD